MVIDYTKLNSITVEELDEASKKKLDSMEKAIRNLKHAAHESAEAGLNREEKRY